VTITQLLIACETICRSHLMFRGIIPRFVKADEGVVLTQIENLLVSILVESNPTTPRNVFLRFLHFNLKEPPKPANEVLAHLDTQFRIEVAENFRKLSVVSSSIFDLLTLHYILSFLLFRFVCILAVLTLATPWWNYLFPRQVACPNPCC